MNYLAIGLAIILLIVIYYIYYYFTNNTLTAGLQPLKTPLTVTYDKLVKPNSYTYSYQAWIYLSSLTGKNQIFYRGSSANNAEFEVDISGQTLMLFAGKDDAAPKQIMTITDNFPIQKWVYLVINVNNLKTYEAYINGKLAKTVNVTTETTPNSSTTSLYIGNTALSGYITKFTRLPSTLDAQQIWKIYLSGNGLNNILTALMPYGLNMSVSTGEDVVRVINVF